MKPLVLRPREYHPPGYTRGNKFALVVYITNIRYYQEASYIITLINLHDAMSAMLKKVLFQRINRVTTRCQIA